MSNTQRKYGLVGFACDFGGSVAGTKEGPRVLRKLGIDHVFQELGLDVKDYGDAACIPGEPKAFSPEEKRAKFAPEVFAACHDLYNLTMKPLRDGRVPVILGGDHSLSIGSVGAVVDYYAERGEKVGLIWVDAHSDINTPDTSPSGNFFGMSVAALLKLFPGAMCTLSKHPVQAENVAFIGLRDVDPGERVIIREKNIHASTMKDIDMLGIAEVVRQAIQVASKGTKGFIVSFDLDVCDDHLVPGTGTPKRGGITFREAHLVLELLAESQKMLSFELVELNPSLDKDHQTAQLALSLLESALGKTIL